MIISHEHRFVFVKTRKTAGTSIEVFLSGIAGDDAVVTPIDPPVAGHTARNYKMPVGTARRLLWRARYRGAERASHHAFYNHISARGIRTQLGARRWDRYFTFCFERNPWEKVVSRFYFAKGRGEFDGTFAEFVQLGDLPSDFGQYSLDGSTVGVDFVGRYEHLEQDLGVALDRIGVEGRPSLTREKGNYRPPDASVDTLFDPRTSRLVEIAFAREIAAFGYTPPAHLVSGADRAPEAG